MRAGNPARPVATLSQALLRAHQAILAHGRAHPEHAGLGTTCAVVWLQGARLFIASVGDSRIYLWQQGRLQQLTTDHTWLQEMAEQGGMALPVGTGHPLGHLLYRHLGSPHHAEPDLRLRLSPGESDAQALQHQGVRLHAGDQILLCTDGLTDLVPDEEIAQALAATDLDAALDRLLALALQRGGRDNITMIGIRLTSGGEEVDGRSKGLGVPPWGVLGVGVMLLFLVTLLGVWVFVLGR